MHISEVSAQKPKAGQTSRMAQLLQKKVIVNVKWKSIFSSFLDGIYIFLYHLNSSVLQYHNQWIQNWKVKSWDDET